MRLATIGVIACALAMSTDADATKRAGKIERVEHRRSEMVFVPGGTFEMGVTEAEASKLRIACNKQYLPVSNTHPCEKLSAYALGGSIGALAGTVVVLHRGPSLTLEPTARTVFVSAFWMDRYEVTGRDYRQCVAAGACDVAPLLAGDPRHISNDKPMVNITLDESLAYCTWRGKRLPTEAEWEKAARGTDGRRFPWGNHIRADGANHGRFDGVGSAIHRSVFIFAPDSSDGHEYAHVPGTMQWTEGPYGTYDQAGNVSEWVQDYFDREGYAGLPRINPVRSIGRPGELMSVVRGGSWLRPRVFARTYFRSQARAGNRSEHRGFRCAKEGS